MAVWLKRNIIINLTSWSVNKPLTHEDVSGAQKFKHL